MSHRRVVRACRVIAVVAAMLLVVLALACVSGCTPSRTSGTSPGGPRRSTTPGVSTTGQPATGSATTTDATPAPHPPGFVPGGPRRHK